MANNRLTSEAWLREHNFTTRPFPAFVAEKEEYLEECFLGLHFLEKLRSKEQVFIWGERGYGKTANCTMLNLYAENSWNKSNAYLAGSHKFNDLIGRNEISLSDHVKCFLPSLVENIYTFIRKSRNISLIDEAIAEYGEFLVCFIDQYAPNQLKEFELIRQIKLIMKGVSVEQKEKVRLAILHGNQKGLKKVLQAFPDYSPYIERIFNIHELHRQIDKSLADDDLELLKQFSTIAEAFGIERGFVLVDKVDQNITDLKKISKMLTPLVNGYTSFETLPFYAFKFFLPTSLKKELLGTTSHFDRFESHQIEWRDEDLKELLARRMVYHTDPNVSDYEERSNFSRIFEDSIRKEVVEDIIKHSHGSPRKLLHLVNNIITEHLRRDNSVSVLISLTTFERVLSKQAEFSDIQSKLETFSLEQLIFICFDFFPKSYQGLNTSLDKEHLIELLLKSCQEENKVSMMWNLLIKKKII